MEDSAEASFDPPMAVGGGVATPICVHISPTTGGDFRLHVAPDCAVDELKKLVSKRLKVPRDRLCLLFRDKQLQEGSILQHGVADGSKITLLPNVETGLVTQRPEIGIMQALESLNDLQVNEFLCGKAPLNLSMRLGDHMMLIQLQLSTVSGTKSTTATTSTPTTTTTNTTTPISSSASSSSAATPTRPPSLTQASRNLQHTLRRLSADVFSGKSEGRKGSVYSGTFSGALNPALQDPKGRPRRDVATIVHILNDLLCAAPELRRVARQGEDAAGEVVGGSGGHAHSLESEMGGGVAAARSAVSEDQNSRTRGKLEQLRLVMGERRERRRQRKRKPYAIPQQGDSDTVTA